MTVEIITSEHEQLARFAKALGHPVRVYIMELLSSQSCCFSGALAEAVPIARPTVSQHLKELRAAGLIQGTIEYPKIRYCVNKENWERAKCLFIDLFNTPILLNTDCENNPGNQSGK